LGRFQRGSIDYSNLQPIKATGIGKRWLKLVSSQLIQKVETKWLDEKIKNKHNNP
jgi:hypothetical protein